MCHFCQQFSIFEINNFGPSLLAFNKDNWWILSWAENISFGSMEHNCLFSRGWNKANQWKILSQIRRFQTEMWRLYWAHTRICHKVFFTIGTFQPKYCPDMCPFILVDWWGFSKPLVYRQSHEVRYSFQKMWLHCNPITGWKQGFPWEVFPHREKPVFITCTVERKKGTF